jgi:predicted dehydrogenase
VSLDRHAPIRIAMVGYGYWGPNIVRNLVERPEFELVGLCERDEERANSFARRHPGVWVGHEIESLLEDPVVEAVSIATPPKTHYPLVKAALEADKHVLVEKPLATTEADAVELIALAEERGLTLMPGHTFLYSPPVMKVRELIEDGVLGEIYFITSSRMNLGIYQADGVICDLAPHDLSILLYWLDQPVVQVTATGRSVFQRGVPETAFLTLTFAGGASANVQISWLAPRKVRQTVVVGSKQMVQYEDTAADESVRIYDRGLDVRQPENFGEYRMTYRSGDMVAPRIDSHEPLGLELEDFARSIHTGSEPRSNARLGLEIVRVLEAAEQSLANHGQPTVLGVDLAAPLGSTPADEPARVGNGNGDGNGNGNGDGDGNGRRVFSRWLSRGEDGLS